MDKYLDYPKGKPIVFNGLPVSFNILPPYTIRVLLDGNDLESFQSYGDRKTTWTFVEQNSQGYIYDVYRKDANWSDLLASTWDAQPPDITHLKKVLAVGDTRGVTNISYMFAYQSYCFTSTVLFDTSNVLRADRAFMHCSELTSVPLFDTSKVTNTYHMFDGCSNLKSVPLFDLSNVTNADSMFRYCTSLRSLPLFNLSKLERANYMFYRCDILRDIPHFDLSHLKDGVLMFYSCNVSTLPLFDFSSLEIGMQMFAACDNLVKIPLFEFPVITDMRGMFLGCDHVVSGALALFNTLVDRSDSIEHVSAFKCGTKTETGRSERNAILSSSHPSWAL